ncbi:MAG: ABC transporter permease [Candidatus Bathyarchaeia archaeon]
MSKISETIGLLSLLREVLGSKSGFTGVSILVLIIAMSFIAVIFYPYSLISQIWNDPEYWKDNPHLALPTWYNTIAGLNLPPNIIFDSRKEDARILKHKITFGNFTEHQITITFSYNYDGFPSEINAYFYAKFQRNPLIQITFVRPDGREIPFWSGSLERNESFVILSNSPIAKKNIQVYYYNTFKSSVYDPPTNIVLFAVEEPGMCDMTSARVLKSIDKNENYRVRIKGIFFEQWSELNVKLIIYGRVYGLLGTDDRRRDLIIPLLWGAPIALSFGISLSVIITFLHLLLGTISAWFGGKVDLIIQKITEIYMIVPFFAVLVLISTFYKINIWTVFISIIILSLFGGGVKSARALALQLKQMPYVEAAIVYGTKSFRIITRYIMYPMLPILIPGIISAIPGFVFLEAALAYLGLGDPTLPTWGKTINEANTAGAVYWLFWWWILPPIIALILLSAAFALIGYSLDKIVNPRLREL